MKNISISIWRSVSSLDEQDFDLIMFCWITELLNWIEWMGKPRQIHWLAFSINSLWTTCLSILFIINAFMSFLSFNLLASINNDKGIRFEPERVAAEITFSDRAEHANCWGNIYIRKTYLHLNWMEMECSSHSFAGCHPLHAQLYCCWIPT